MSIRCPKCLYHEQSYQAGFGKVVRNPYALAHGRVEDDCDACEGSGYVPDLIVNAIRDVFTKSADEILPVLRWSGDHWSFSKWGIYIGIERDGYIHS